MRLIYTVLFLTSLFYIGCAPATPSIHGVTTHERIVINSGIDFQKYSNEGFFFSSDQYNGDYYLMRAIDMEVKPAFIKYFEGKVDSSQYSVLKIFGRENGGYYENVYLEEKLLIDSVVHFAYQEAKAANADAIVKFRLERGSIPNGPLFNRVFYIKGEAIKRLNK
jgi:hypothetical protein